MTDDLRRRYAEAIARELPPEQMAVSRVSPTAFRLADAVLAVRDDELARLRAKVAAFESAGSSSNVTVTMPWPHDPIPDCLTNHCDTHGVDERDDDAYRVCGECGHVFPTEADLLRDYEQRTIEVGAPFALKRAEDIRFCPHCSHDF